MYCSLTNRQDIVEGRYRIVLTSPEMLLSKRFSLQILRDNRFAARVRELTLPFKLRSGVHAERMDGSRDPRVNSQRLDLRLRASTRQYAPVRAFSRDERGKPTQRRCVDPKISYN
jgi:hypothetical protein